MAYFDPAQTVDVLSINQLLNEWAKELDDNNGVGVGPMVTEDCSYNVPGKSYQGRAEVVKYYEARLAGLKAAPTGVPIHRHVMSNLCVEFTGADIAKVSFVMVYYSDASIIAGNNRADPVLVGDGDMVVCREADGHWRIARLDTEAILVRFAG